MSLIPLDDYYALVRVSGADATLFLQSQLTCDVRTITGEHWVAGAYCTPKGRVIAVLVALRHAEEIALVLPKTLAHGLVERLGRYVLRAKVKLDLAQGFSIAGRLSTDPDGESDGLPAASGQAAVVRAGTALVTALRMPGTPKRWLMIGEAGTLPPGKLSSGYWRLLDIQAGFPMVLPETSEAFTPQMLNLDKLGAVSFEKGCYPGQEIVARTRYLGRVKQRMVRFRLAGGTARPGDSLYAADFPEQAAGHVVDAQHVTEPAGADLPSADLRDAGLPTEMEMLAVLQTSIPETGDVHIGSLSGPRLERLPLPYSTED